MSQQAPNNRRAEGLRIVLDDLEKVLGYLTGLESRLQKPLYNAGMGGFEVGIDVERTGKRRTVSTTVRVYSRGSLDTTSVEKVIMEADPTFDGLCESYPGNIPYGQSADPENPNGPSANSVYTLAMLRDIYSAWFEGNKFDESQ